MFLARDVPVGVVLRRGPTDWVRLSLWRTDSDVFEYGQWFRGRVYERRCDVSPDGSLFAYFAYKASAKLDLGVDSWAAISRPPWFSALALWGIGSTYFAGGFFPDRRSVVLGGISDAPDRGELPAWLKLSNDLPYVDRTTEWTNRTVFFSRLLRGGWQAVPSVEHPDPHWERTQPGGTSRLIMAPIPDASFDSYGGRSQSEYTLQAANDVFPLGEATWADWDHGGRLVLAQAGRLVEVLPDGGRQVLQDFNAQRPGRGEAPAWAHEWPARTSRQ